MILNIESDLDYGLAGPSSVLLQLEAAPLADQTIHAAHIDVRSPDHFTRVPGEEGIGERIWIEAQGRLTCTYRARVGIDRREMDISRLAQMPAHLLPGDVIRFLMASRYCQSDLFQTFVAAEFGDLSGGARIVAMRDWINRRFLYVPGSSNAQTTALDTFV